MPYESTVTIDLSAMYEMEPFGGSAQTVFSLNIVASTTGTASKLKKELILDGETIGTSTSGMNNRMSATSVIETAHAGELLLKLSNTSSNTEKSNVIKVTTNITDNTYKEVTLTGANIHLSDTYPAIDDPTVVEGMKFFIFDCQCAVSGDVSNLPNQTVSLTGWTGSIAATFELANNSASAQMVTDGEGETIAVIEPNTTYNHSATVNVSFDNADIYEGELIDHTTCHAQYSLGTSGEITATLKSATLTAPASYSSTVNALASQTSNTYTI